MRKNSPTASTARRGAKPSPVRAILPISTSPRRSPERSSPTSPDAWVVAPTGRDHRLHHAGRPVNERSGRRQRQEPRLGQGGWRGQYHLQQDRDAAEPSPEGPGL